MDVQTAAQAVDRTIGHILPLIEEDTTMSGDGKTTQSTQIFTALAVLQVQTQDVVRAANDSRDENKKTAQALADLRIELVRALGKLDENDRSVAALEYDTGNELTRVKLQIEKLTVQLDQKASAEDVKALGARVDGKVAASTVRDVAEVLRTLIPWVFTAASTYVALRLAHLL